MKVNVTLVETLKRCVLPLAISIGIGWNARFFRYPVKVVDSRSISIVIGLRFRFSACCSDSSMISSIIGLIFRFSEGCLDSRSTSNIIGLLFQLSVSC